MHWHTQELTLPEFWNPPTPPTVNRGRWQRDTLERFERRASWGGMSKADTLTLPQRGWPSGVDAALRLIEAPDVATVGAARLQRRWSHDDGETLDVARFYDGLPCWRSPHRAPGGSGGRILTLVCHAGGNCDLKADQIAWKAYAAVRYVDAMEAAGYRVAVDASFAARKAYRAPDPEHGMGRWCGWHCLVHVKEPDAPVDLSQLAAVLSAAAFRWYGFTWEACCKWPLESARGVDYDKRPDDPAAVYLPARVADRQSAQRWLASVNAEDGRA